MGLFEHFPYTNYHELNLDWLVEQVKKNSDILAKVYPGGELTETVLIGKISNVNGTWICDKSRTLINQAILRGDPMILYVQGGINPNLGIRPATRIAQRLNALIDVYTAPYVDTANSKIVQDKFTIALDGTITLTTEELSV